MLYRPYGRLRPFNSLSRTIQNDDHAHDRQRHQYPHFFIFHFFPFGYLCLVAANNDGKNVLQPLCGPAG